jgi:hypothetical protein
MLNLALPTDGTHAAFLSFDLDVAILPDLRISSEDQCL